MRDFRNAPRQREPAPEAAGDADLNSGLVGRIEDLANELLGVPSFRDSKALRYGAKGGLKVNTSGRHAGRWWSFEDHEGGGPLELIARERAIPPAEAEQWARDWLAGLAVENGGEPIAGSAAVVRTTMPSDDTERQRKTEAAGGIWRQSSRIADTKAEAYLQARGIYAPPGDVVRFHPSLSHGPTKKRLPALVARVDGPDGGPVAIHRTYLDPRAPVKAAVEPNKMALGPVGGGAVRIGGAASKIALAEGIETALTIYQATGLPCWAVLGTSGMAGVTLPGEVREILLCADNDKNEAGANAARELAERLTAEGRAVRIVMAPRTGFDSAQKSVDFNDVLMRFGNAAVRALVDTAPIWEPDPNRRALPKGVIPGVSPQFPENPLPLHQACELLRREVSGWLNGEIDRLTLWRELKRERKHAVAQALADNAELDPELYPERASDYRAMRRDVRTAATTAVLTRLGMQAVPKTRRLQIKAAAGLGKTEAVIQAVREAREQRPKARHLVMHYFVPTHILAAALAERFGRAGVPAYVIRGRTAKGPNGKTMCCKPKLADKIARLGLPVAGTICESGTLRCRWRDTCDYFRQSDHAEAGGVWIMSHHYLTLPRPEGVPKADLVVVDEDYLGVFEDQRSIPTEYVAFAAARLPDDEHGIEAKMTCETVRRALLGDSPLNRALAYVDIDALARAADALEAIGNRDRPAVNPQTGERAALERLEGARESPARLVAVLLRQLAKELPIVRGKLHGIDVRMAPAKTESGETVYAPRVFVRRRAAPRISSRRPLLLIDANAEPKRARNVWGQRLEHREISVHRVASVTQVGDLSFAKSSLLVSSAMSERTAKTVRNRLAKVHRFIDDVVTLHGAGRVLVAANKPVRCALTGEANDADLPNSFDLGGATVTHFGRIRGVDDWRGCGAVVVVGREQAPAAAVEALARALYWDDSDPLHLPGDYENMARGYRTADGARLGVMVHVHPDFRVQSLLERAREEEATQAIDRIRLIHRQVPGNVYILTKTPIDVTVDRLVGFDDLLVETGVIAAGRRRGVLPLSAPWLAEHEPALLVPNAHGENPTVRACEIALAKLNLGQGVNRNSPIETLYRTFSVYRARYRTENKGKYRHALVSADSANPQSVLADSIGRPVIEFEASVPSRAPLAAPEGRPSAPASPLPPDGLVSLVARLSGPAGAVAPFRRVALPVESEIHVRPAFGFPDCAVWDRAGRFAGWDFRRFWLGAAA